MHAKTCLGKILKNHGWECGMKEKDKIIEPIYPDLIKELKITIGPTSDAESNQLEAEEGFSYCGAIAHHQHTVTTKQLNEYSAIQQTIDWGLIFWQQEPRNDLPEGAHI
eukprot:1630051-Ditylum_brightwellii.AAC.2